MTAPATEALPLDLKVMRACAERVLAEDGRLRLRAEPGRTPSARIALAQVLARSVIALCDHYENGDHQCPSGPERSRAGRVPAHPAALPGCPACRTVNDDGEAIYTCETADRLYAEYRQARRGPLPVPVSETATGGRGPDRDGM